MQIEVIYAEPERILRCQIEVPEGITVGACLSIASTHPHFEKVDCTRLVTGIFGEQCGLERVARPGDRVELYRPLVTDAKTARRLRAQQQHGAGSER